MTAVPSLSVTCGCGRSISIECQTVADIPAAQAMMDGWGFDEAGRVRCPEHLSGEIDVPPPTPADARQHELFGAA